MKTKKFHSAYEAAEYATTITDEWKSESDEIMHKEDLLSFMSIADEEGEIDEDNEEFYYVVTDAGTVGVTSDAEKMITWLATPTKIKDEEPVEKKSTKKTTTSKKKENYCSNCGTKIEVDAKFCTSCGEKIALKINKLFCTKCGKELSLTDDFCSNCGTPVNKESNKKTSKKGIPANRPHGQIGFSNVINDPRFIRAVNNNKSSNRGCALIFVLAPLVILTLYSIFSSEIEVIYGLFLGGVISGILYILYFIATIKDRFESSWDGEVIDKYDDKTRIIARHASDKDYNWRKQYYLIIRRDNGRKVKIEEQSTDTYNYFKVGDRIRYHGKMGLLFPYEKYDKSNDEYVLCAFCKTRAPIVDDVCPKCNKPILK